MAESAGNRTPIHDRDLPTARERGEKDQSDYGALRTSKSLSCHQFSSLFRVFERAEIYILQMMSTDDRSLTFT